VVVLSVIGFKLLTGRPWRRTLPPDESMWRQLLHQHGPPAWHAPIAQQGQHRMKRPVLAALMLTLPNLAFAHETGPAHIHPHSDGT
jgi:hypothetical protein